MPNRVEAPKSPLEVYRDTHNLTQQALADLLGVSQSFIANIENGKRPVTPQKAIDWAPILGMDRATLCPEIFGVHDADRDTRAATA